MPDVSRYDMGAEQLRSIGTQLGGWSRFGVVLSGLWLVAIGTWAAYEYIQWEDVCFDSYKRDRCNEKGLFTAWELAHTKSAIADRAESTRFEELPADLAQAGLELIGRFAGNKHEKHFNPQQFLAVLVLPVVLGWILCWLSVRLWRWVRRGFEQKVEPR
jgi:hypothetical protein